LELSGKYHLDPKTIRKRLNRSDIVEVIHNPSKSVVLMDTTYFSRLFGVMVFRDNNTHKNIYWKIVKYETITEYISGIDHVLSLGFKVNAIVCDGRRGIFNAFKDIPVQMCQFHQTMIIRRYLTNNPRLEASIELLCIVKKLTKTDENSFKGMLIKWYEKWGDYLKERTINTETGKWYYTHKKLRSAYRSLITNMPYLFTYQNYPHLNIPNTTNGLEGIFSDIKTHVRIHKGIQFKNKIKLIDDLLKK